ncbi:MAG: vWA domain-containing protein [Candidatus Hydrogenedentota bacterium]
MISRRFYFAVSVILSVVLHAALLLYAPRISMLERRHEMPEPLARFEVDLLEELPPEEEEWDEPNQPVDPPRLPDAEPAMPGDDSPAEPEEMEPLPERPEPDPSWAERTQPRTPEDTLPAPGEPGEDLVAELDRDVLAISQEDAREDIDVERRTVEEPSTPSLAEDVEPSLGSSLAPVDDLLFPRSALPATRDTGEHDTMDVIADAFGPPRQPLEGAVGDRPPAFQGLPDLPADTPLGGGALQAELEGDGSDYETMDDLLDIRVESYIPPEGGDGYFRIQITPQPGTGLDVLPRDITFVIDASRSVQQRKMDLITQGLREPIWRMRDEDRFQVIVFRDTATRFRQDWAKAATEAREAAHAFVERAETRGETDIYNALREVMETSSRPGIPSIVLLISDGYPTEGVVDGRTLINRISEENQGGHTIFAFAGGHAIDRYLLELLAYRNRGEVHIAPSISDVVQHLPQFMNRLQDPVLVDLDADYGQIDSERIFPKTLPDFYLNHPVNVYGRFDPDGETVLTMRLTGWAEQERKEVVFGADLMEALTDNANIARGWGFRKAYDLIGEIARQGETPPLMNELQSVSRQYGIRTSYDQ